MISKKRAALAALLCAGVFFSLGFAAAYNRSFPYMAVVRASRLFGPIRPDANENWVLQAKIYRQAELASEVTMFGDSLTGFGPWNVLMPRVKVDNRGIPGESSMGLLQRLQDGEPAGKTAVVWTGVNDDYAGLSDAASVDNLRKIIGLLGNRNIVVVGTLLTERDKQNTKIRALNVFQKSLCGNGRCRYVDLNSVVAPEGRLKSEYTLDGVHLNWAGYRAISPVLENAVLTNSLKQ